MKPTKQSDTEIILGVDPGLASTGWGIIKKEKSNISLVDYGCISTSPEEPFSSRLKQIHEKLKKIIKNYKPARIALEDLFFAKNAKSALKIGEVRGVIKLTAIQCQVPLIEFTPLQIKQAITGYGRADKNQISQMVKLNLNLKEIPKPDHAADALAIAICCSQTNRKLIT
ncbi:crossover junction endodeoxyribonuclease RuvC [Candidatus Falkowbacteria bacterium]|nr:crossover junction endodeoxyribonuclease RuvC [Candidatus Falkowbacteria bacterium]